jgi:hypothetical protein
VTIYGSTIEDHVSEAMAQPTVNDRAAHEKAGRAGAQEEDQQVQKSQASAARPPGQRSTPGRRALFRTS